MSLVVGTAQRTCAGQTVCGDGLTVDHLDGACLVSVVDGLGHGPEAAEAARAFMALVAQDPTLPPLVLMRLAGEKLARTRGAAAALLRFDFAPRRAEFVGVGNIRLHSDARMHAVCMPGVVGKPVRRLAPFGFDLPPAALVAVCSDGIAAHIRLEDYGALEPQAAAEAVLEEHGRPHDDATCVVIRYRCDD